ncbi:MAG: hypothetical protein JWO38_899 [Gemmataceae bacterium]|nr:hypothetical protein [Gemmataceae bacterium]
MFWTSRLERKDDPLASQRKFFIRVGRNFLATLGIVVFSLAMGTLGYHYFGRVSWLDGLLNASMILTGMGPVDRMESPWGKLFATLYALYSGLAFLTMMAVLLTPVYHRLIHRFHLSRVSDAGPDRPPETEPASSTPPS